MSAKIYVLFKFLWFYLYSGATPFIAQILTTNSKTPSDIMFWFLILGQFLFEIGWVTSKNFRVFIIEGLRDGDGVLKKKDVQDTLMFYATYCLLRVAVVMGISPIFYEVQIKDTHYAITVLAAMGPAGLTVLSRFSKQ